jgi:hypothetical protein
LIPHVHGVVQVIATAMLFVSIIGMTALLFASAGNHLPYVG